MAEIKIEKKKSYWLWILIVMLLLAGLIYLYFSMTNVSDKYTGDSSNNTEIVTQGENASAVDGFIGYVNNDTNKMGLDHTFTNNALLKLRQAIEAVANKTGYDVKADLSRASEYAEKITNDPFETSHADNIKKSTEILSTSLSNLQQSKYPALTAEAGEVKNASDAINPDVLTLDQKENVKAFFHKAADLLAKMN